MRALRFIWEMVRPLAEVIAAVVGLFYMVSLVLLGFPGLWAFSEGHWILGTLYFLPVAAWAITGIIEHAKWAWWVPR